MSPSFLKPLDRAVQLTIQVVKVFVYDFYRTSFKQLNLVGEMGVCADLRECSWKNDESRTYVQCHQNESDSQCGGLISSNGRSISGGFFAGKCGRCGSTSQPSGTHKLK